MHLIDAHQHYWSLSTPGHAWPTPAEAAIHRDFGPIDLASQVQGRLSLTGTILVQSQPTDADTDWMLALSDREASVLGVVGWVDLADPHAPARIATLATHPKLRGLRPMLQSIADTHWLLDNALSPAIEAMIAHGLRFDALIQPRHLPMLYRFARRWPDLPIVIDHAAKPHIAAQALDPWRADIARLADVGLWCKFSGLRTEQAIGAPPAQLAPYATHLLDCFADRLMWGSDWPVVHMAGDDYSDWHSAATQLAGVDGAAHDRLFAEAAREFYGVQP